MLVTERERLSDRIKELAERFGRHRRALLPILQEVQSEQRHVSPFAMQIIADVLGIHPVEVYSVVTFYSFLDHEPKGHFVIRLCRTISCDMAGRDEVARQLENDLGIGFGETTQDTQFTLEWTSCLGMCDLGPAMLVNDRVYTEVTPGQVHAILEECRQVFRGFATRCGEELLA
ncbi:MAG: NADH-quinone oxidoreductase subunit NuoE [bacterium]